MLKKKQIAYVLFSVLPFIVLAWLLLLARGGVWAYHPSNSDELGYWRELYNEYASNQKVTGLNIYAGHETLAGNFSSHGVSPSVIWYLPGGGSSAGICGRYRYLTQLLYHCALFFS